MHDPNCDNGDTDLDPRIQIELEKLNTATDKINILEVQLDEANTTFRMLLNESIKNLKTLSKKLGGCIERARPYYDALETAKKAQLECQKAAIQYQRANEIHQAAKETVALAEERFLSKQHEWQFDNAWQEMLNHATMKVMEAETKKTESGLEHQKRAVLFNEAEQKLQHLELSLRRCINKSRPYFEEKELCQRHLATQKERVEILQKQVASVKHSYACSLKKLERISEEIHKKRGDTVRGVREPGVGAENHIIAEMNLEKYNSNYKTLEPEICNNTKYAMISNSTTHFLEKNSLKKFYENAKLNGERINSTILADLDYELELDRCELQSLGSMSATTSSALSDEDCGEDDSEAEELKQMAFKISTKTDSGEINLNNSFETKENEPCQKTRTDKLKNFKRISENWEKQMSETLNKLGTILNLKQRNVDCYLDNKEKY